ncbi:MAG: hypothetical protein IT175_13795 [Acidobacteria bacterium]|nr:hypothetical protein [Acidobacteriota bacterium]
MNIRNLMTASLATLVALPAAATAASAQAPAAGAAPVAVVAGQSKAGKRSQAVFISSEMSFEGKIVKGAPYTAETINESVHTLGDGNRIVSTNRGSVARDGEGRLRREHSISQFGPFARNAGPSTMVFITDPVSKTNYIVDTNEKTVRKMPIPNFFVWHDGKNGDGVPGEEEVVVTVDTNHPDGETIVRKEIRGKEGKTDVTVERRAGTEGSEDGPNGVIVVTEGTENIVGPPDVSMRRPGPPGPIGMGPMAGGFRYEVTEMGEPRIESLGKKTVEGVECDGTRTTVTIAAGAIGNERPIDIVSEVWYSPELQLTVSSRHNDPRFGETSYRLTNIVRAEPDKALFMPPPDYKVEDAPFRKMLRKHGRPAAKVE